MSWKCHQTFNDILQFSSLAVPILEIHANPLEPFSLVHLLYVFLLWLLRLLMNKSINEFYANTSRFQWSSSLESWHSLERSHYSIVPVLAASALLGPFFGIKYGSFFQLTITKNLHRGDIYAINMLVNETHHVIHVMCEMDVAEWGKNFTVDCQRETYPMSKIKSAVIVVSKEIYLAYLLEFAQPSQP